MVFAVENFGDSPLAERFGIKRYPAVFVDDVLVAKPKDFGFYGDGGSQGEGRYVPWRDADNQARFRRDLTRMIELVLAGESERLRAEHGRTADGVELTAMPSFTLTDLEGRTLDAEALADRVVVVEFWASWCPPCRDTLDWLATLRGRYGDAVAVVGIAVESPEDAVRQMIGPRASGVRWAMGTPAIAAAFGDVVAVPTLFVFDRGGRTAATFYGAPADLHRKAEAVVTSLLEEPVQRSGP